MDRPEIVIGLVGALGTNMDRVVEAIEKSLAEVDYDHTTIRLSHLLRDVPALQGMPLKDTPYEAQLDSYMNAGNAWRNHLNRGDAMALLGMARIREHRSELNKQTEEGLPIPEEQGAIIPVKKHAFLLRSLKHPDEVETLREVYGSAFFLLSVYEQRSKRIRVLTQQIMQSHNSSRREPYEHRAVELINRDEAEVGEDLGQQVSKTFWRGDAFIDVGNLLKLDESVNRIIQIWFGHPFHTPTNDEYLMFCAQATAYRSASLGRQVGAVIATREGSIVATGTNEVPKAGGGVYGTEDVNDARDHIRGQDSSDIMRRELLGDIIQRLQENHWLAEDRSERSLEDMVSKLLDGQSAIMKEATFNNLIEYQRPVHAEMTALTDAARRGVPVADCTLYASTFPCHGCARHIVAAGIRRVVFIEPYVKSLARDFHEDSICIEDCSENTGMVRFEPFVGLAPRRYMDLFALNKFKKRKETGGKASTWKPHEATPLLGGELSYRGVHLESIRLDQLHRIILDIARRTQDKKEEGA